MNVRRMICLALALLLALLIPIGALAAKKPSIKMGGKLGLLFVDQKVQLRPKLNGVRRTQVRFESSDPSVATVSDTGEVRAAGEGRAMITVSGGGAVAKCGVVVLPRSLTLQAGEKRSLANGTLERYAAKDAAIAKVSKQGVITAQKAGKTVIRVKYGAQKRDIGVTVAEGTSTGESPVASLDAASQTDQIVLVEYSKGSKATLSVHEKKDGQWIKLLETAAYVGKNGIGKKREGDKKTPTGTFNLTTPFGIKADPGAQMPYTKVTKYHYWCGTSGSGYYNQLVDSRQANRKCAKSDEHLIDYKGYYNYAMFIDYNASGEANKGSCIFLHCKGKNTSTAGCVAISEASMKKIICWARAGAKIVIRKK